MTFVWGSAVLDDRMSYVKVGDKVRITYEGETTNKRNQRLNLFKVEVASNLGEPGGSDETEEVKKEIE